MGVGGLVAGVHVGEGGVGSVGGRVLFQAGAGLVQVGDRIQRGQWGKHGGSFKRVIVKIKKKTVCKKFR